MNGENEVYIDRCEAYTIENIVSFLDKSTPIFYPLAGLNGAKVLLKPNLISSRGKGCGCTHPCVVVGVVRWLINHGAIVYLGDSPAFGSVTSVLEKLGLTEILSDLGVGIVEFKTGRRVVLSSGVKLVLAAELFEYDLVVNLPKIKAHDQLFMTMAVKNFFGAVKGFHKARLHMSHGGRVHDFADILLELLAVLPTNVTIADGVEVMHRRGPLGGESLMLGVMAAAINPVALDIAMLALLELDFQKSPVHLLAHRKKKKGVRLSELVFPILDPSSFKGSCFVAPERLSPVRFHPLRYLSGLIKRILLNNRLRFL